MKTRSTIHSSFAPKIDVGMAKILVSYTLSKHTTGLQLAAVKKFIDALDIQKYASNYDIYSRLILSRKIAHARTDDGLTQLDLIKTKVSGDDASLEKLIKETKWANNLLSPADNNMVTNFVDEKLRYYFFYSEMPEIVKIYERIINADGFDMSSSDLADLNARMCNLALMMQPTTISTGLMRQFNFSDPNIMDAIKFIVDKANKPASVLQTGIRHLNSLLGPGFRGSKLYTILGMSGKFKSGTLLNLADQIRKFNPQLEDVVDGKRNTILFITMENSIEETIERVFSMYSPAGEKILKRSSEEVYQIITETGGYTYTDKKGIDIQFMYFSNMEINTAKIYNIIDDMEKNGAHCIALILDYIKKIDSVFDHHGDDVQRMTYVARELKTIAEFYNIPVITAQQINRMGNAIIDAAMRDGKEDLLRFIGNSDIGGAWGVVEESDWIALISLERSKKNGKLYLSFKNTKNRAGKDPTISDYFNHPFCDVNDLRLETDMDKEGSLSVLMLSSDLESVEIKEDTESPQERPKFKSMSISQAASPLIEKIGFAGQHKVETLEAS